MRGVALTHEPAHYLLDTALDYYERAFDEGNAFLQRIGTSPEFDQLHDHPRFKALLRRMKLPLEEVSAIAADPIHFVGV